MCKKGIDDQVLWKHSLDGKTITFQNRTCTKRKDFWYSKEKKNELDGCVFECGILITFALFRFCYTNVNIIS
jgi:hypothetical protein